MESLDCTYKLGKSHKWLTKGVHWEQMADMNETHTEVSNSSVVLNDQIWVMGGWNGSNALKSVEMYDPQTNIWKNMK